MNTPKLMALALLALLASASAAEPHRRWLGGTSLPPLDSTTRLEITGSNGSDTSQVIVIRIDDSGHPGYAERVNIERVVPPGTFRLTLGLGGLAKSNHTPLNLAKVTQLIVFAGTVDAPLTIDPLRFSNSEPLADGAVGWDLGPVGSAIWPEFTLITPEFKGIHGRQLQAIDRGKRQPAHDGFTSDGIRGIETLQLPLPAGRWRVTLWIDDRGEWEYLPHPLQRSIRANGVTVYSHTLSPREWVAQRYLAGLAREYQPGDSVWELYGRQPQGRVTFQTHIDDTGLMLRFGGHLPEAGFLAGVLAEPVAATAALTQVNQALERWWQENWPVSPVDSSVSSYALRPLLVYRTVARGTSSHLELELHAPSGSEVSAWALTPLALGDRQLDTSLRWGRWQLRRSRLSSSLLVPADHHLRAATPLPRGNGLPRKLHLQVTVPRDLPAGIYRGQLTVTVDGQTLTQALSVTVPEVDLPPLDRPVGVYLERPPQFGWFPELSEAKSDALRCDLEYLRGVGLSGLSPGLTTPDSSATAAAFGDEMARVKQVGFIQPLAYAPYKRLLAQQGAEQAALRLKAAQQLLQSRGLDAPIWSIADEPSNPGESQHLATSVRYLRAFAPDARLAGHLNDTTDSTHLPLFDVALVNAGFGVDADDIARIKAAGVTPWFYNMEDPRKAAGFYLWATDSRGYLQWHARMPTAAPYDPTDGREDDVQWLYAGDDSCPPVPDVDQRLFALIEGINDLRWLLWLDQAAQQNPAAERYRQWLKQQIPAGWPGMLAIPEQSLDRWRAGIQSLATPR